MCQKPRTINGVQVSCRECDDCIKAYKNGWVARLMAERATAGFCLAVMLSYRNLPNGEKPDGARTFEYAHVRQFMMRLRSAYTRQHAKSGEIRFFVAGEMGERRKRCHWHILLFARAPLDKLGHWQTLDGAKLAEPIYPADGSAKEQIWSMWPHGLVGPQIPDQGGVSYVAKYAQKDRYGMHKAKGTTREGDAEVHAASLVRMSKKPPLGWDFVQAKLERLREAKAVPPTTRIQVPEYSGYWWPTGPVRERYLIGLHDINEEIRRETGRDAPQWASLLHEISQTNSEKDLENLLYGAEQDTIWAEKGTSWLADKTRNYQKARSAERKRRACAGVLPCRKCLNNLRQGQPDTYRVARKYAETLYRQFEQKNGQISFPEYNARAKRLGIVNRWCQLREENRADVAAAAAIRRTENFDPRGGNAQDLQGATGREQENRERAVAALRALVPEKVKP